MRTLLTTLICAIALAGCSSASQLSTAALGGGNSAKPTQAAAPPAQASDTATARAFKLAAVSARAQKCGYNIDAQKLKANFMQSETLAGATPETLSKLEQVYQTSYSGVQKGITQNNSYCTKTRTTLIKKSLDRYLAGNFSAPSVRTSKKKTELSFWERWGTPGDDKGPKFGSPEWWDAQRAEASN